MKKPDSRSLLLVEGYSDKRFLLGLQRHAKLGGKFDVRFPAEESSNKGKSGALTQFSMWLEEAAEPGRHNAIGLCVDADNSSIDANYGFSSTEKEIKKRLAEAEFTMYDARRRLYQHKKSKSRASFWISPDQKSDGYVESLAINSLNAQEMNFINSTVNPFISGLPDQRFNSENIDRAKLYSYLAIQAKPDKSLPTLVDDGLIDIGRPPLSLLSQWLQDLFG